MPTGSKLVIVDSSGWIEYLADGPKAAEFAPYFEQEDRLLVPAIVVYEVYRKLLRERGPSAAERFFSQALRLQPFNLDPHLAIAAAHESHEHALPMADAVIYAAARLAPAELVTSDSHFRGLPAVTIV